jgi:hypothetical protein
MMALKINRRGLSWIGMILSVICLFLLLRGLDLSAVVGTLSEVHYVWLLVALLLYWVVVWLKVIRWRTMFYREPVRHSKALSAFSIGYLFNAVMPARLGELVRAYVIGELEHISKAFALSTIVAEKVLDVVMVLLLLLLSLPAFVQLPHWAQTSSLTAVAFFLVLFVVIVAVARKKERLLSVAESLLQHAPRHSQGSASILRGLESLLSGLSILSRRDLAIRLWGLSLVSWIINIPAVWALLVALRVPLSTPFLAATFVLCLTSLGMTIPSSPGYIGPFHYIAVLALSVFAVSREMSMSFAILLHLYTILPISLLGVVMMWRENYSLGRLQSAGLGGSRQKREDCRNAS